MAIMKDMSVPRPGGHSYKAPSLKLGRSQFDRSHGHKTSFNAGDLVPYYVDEVLPGDTFNLKLDALVRIFSPLDAPIMDDIEVGIDFFFVPNRLVWANWQAFLGEHDAAGAQDTDYTIPILDSGSTSPNGAGTGVAKLQVYMGLPDILAHATGPDVNALPFRAYTLIYDEWYRDQNLIDSDGISTGDGPDSSALFNLYKSAKKHDYFTSMLPYIQKGTAVTVPLSGGAAPIEGIGIDSADADGALGPVTVFESGSGSNPSYSQGWQIDDTVSSSTLYVESDGSNEPQIFANLTNIQALTLNQLRESAAIQRLLERDARGGTRYTELVQAHFGVTVPDYRVQRPEYLGGGKGWINISPVANTSDTTGADQGELHGIGAGRLRASFAKSFVEHGYVLGILRARGNLTYQQGLDRMWSRSTRYDFYWPEFAMLSEQEVLSKELFVDNSATDDTVLGYQERYAEYRFKKSLVTGLFCSDTTGTIDYWHLAEDFANAPTLNQTFIEDATPMSRVTTDDTADDFIIDGWFNLKCARPMPVRVVPSLMSPRF